MQAVIQRASTGDRGPPGAAMTVDILTVEQLGPKMSRLPNGSLLCRDVPIARVGWMMYGPGETPVRAGPNGVAYVERTADELFSADTVGSFMAAAVIDEHPFGEDSLEGVTPKNWKRLSKGFATTNVRRGQGADSDVLLADLIITDQSLIESVLAGKREVSCGYDADYEQTGPGLGRQTRITGNHIALVRKGRCGPRCAIGDHSTIEGTEMTKRVPLQTPRRAVVDDSILAARQRVNDAQAALEELEEGSTADEDGAVHVHIHQAGEGEPLPKAGPTEDRMCALETTVSELAETVSALVEKLTPVTAKTADELAAEAAEATAAALKKAQEDEDKDPKTGKTMDSAALADSFAKVLAQAEVLVPGFRMPTFDAALPRKQTVDGMCQARRKCLDAAYATKDGQELIDGISGTKGDLDLASMDCAAAAVLFNAASGARALMNNRAATGDGKTGANAGPAVKPIVTAADLNELHEKFWAAQQASTAT